MLVPVVDLSLTWRIIPVKRELMDVRLDCHSRCSKGQCLNVYNIKETDSLCGIGWPPEVKATETYLQVIHRNGTDK